MRASRTLVLAALLAAAAAVVPAPALALQGIVRAQGGQFVLDGQPFRFVGTNAYYMAIMTALGSPAHADDELALAQALGFTVLRVWGFADGTGDGMGSSAFQPAAGVYNETAFRALDYVLYKADLAGVRLIIPLVNGNPDYGGTSQYIAWCAPGSGERAFYENTGCRALYRNYASYVLNRVNTYNGRRYKDDPAVFAWELANEPHVMNGVDRSGSIVRAWVAEMAAHLKSIDPNHMVATGEEGYDVTTSGYSPLSAYNDQGWLFDGNKGLAWTQNTGDPNIDFGSIHLYPEYWNLAASQGSTWIADHAAIARDLGKPLVLGEFGASQNTATSFDGWLRTWQAEAVGGALAWQVMCGVCYGMRDQFGIVYPPSGSATTVLAQYAATASAPAPAPTAPAFTVGGTSATPATVAPAQAVAVQTTVTAAGAASGILVDLAVRDAAGQTVARQSYAAQTFADGQTRAYGWTWPGTATPGSYRVAVTVSDAAGATVYAAVDPAATVTVQAASTAPFAIGPTAAVPAPLAPGQTLTVTTGVTAAAAASGIIVDLRIFNSAGRKIAEKSYSRQKFSAGQTRSYGWAWSSPSTLPPDTYRVAVAVYGAKWTPLYVSADAAAGFSVEAATAPSATVAFAVGPTSAGPDPVSRGQAESVATAVTAAAAAAGINVDLEIYDPQGRQVAQRIWSGQTFGAGQTRSYDWSWTVGSALPTGTYTVKVGVFDSTWAILYTWDNGAATFTVQ